MYIILNLMDTSTVFSNSTETTFSLSLLEVIQEYHYYLTFGILYYVSLPIMEIRKNLCNVIAPEVHIF